MNALTVLCFAAVAACSSGQLYGYPGVYSYPGVLGAYPGVLPYAGPIALKTFDPRPVTLKTVSPTAIAFKNIASVAPVTPVKSQYHAQDELGQYSFGYAGGPSSQAETRDAFGVVRGSFNYVDSEGKVQTQHYVADALGFRTASTNLPVAPEDTPEVSSAKATLKTLQDEAAAAVEAAPNSRKKRSVVTASPFPHFSPLHFSYGFSSPLTYSHPTLGNPLFYNAGVPAFNHYQATPTAAVAPAAAREAELLRVVNNPGHALSYRVE